MHDDFVLQGSPCNFYFFILTEKKESIDRPLLGLSLWKCCHSSWHAAQPASEGPGKRPPEKRQTERIFQNILVYRRKKRKKERKKNRRKKKPDCLTNHSWKARLSLACKTRTRVLCFILLDNNILWEKYKSKQSDDVVKRKKIASQFILFTTDNMKQGSSLKKAFYEKPGYLKVHLIVKTCSI